MRRAIVKLCKTIKYEVVDAGSEVSGRDFLLKIWKQIAATPLSIGICHEEIPAKTQANIFYELGVAQALGKETVIIKSVRAEIPSDFARTEYIPFDAQFANKFRMYLSGLLDQAAHYEIMADQLDRNPILAIDYLKRAFLITGDEQLRTKARQLLNDAGIDSRATNSVEILSATF